ncbi:Putative cytochrome p450 4v2 [Trichuris trichiura]|uniref:Putative cytochrome p450 4v2 n=1 Tax=Trichuris trichiura TaxID=36087 RepID=A0A077YXG9_TRITR|nr:Putative cytochrome p450 4v2 [Trichuris trichiura]
MRAMAISFAVVLVVLATFIVHWFLRLRKLRQLVDKIHGPRYIPVLGSILYMKTDPAGKVIYPRSFIWHCCFLSISSHVPRLAVHPSCRSNRWRRSVQASSPLDGSGTVDQVFFDSCSAWLTSMPSMFSEAAQWRPRRKLLTPTFHYDILKDFVEVFNQQSRVLLSKIDQLVKEGNEKINTYQHVTLCALDIICETAMGRHVNAQKNSESAYVRAVYTLNGIIHRRQKNPLLRSDFVHRLFSDGKEERREEVQRLGGWTKVLNRELSSYDFDMCSQKRRLAFLDLLLQMAEQGNLTDQDVREEVDTFMFEGHDTTSTAMNWFLHLVGCSPEIQAKIHDELDSIFGDDDRDATFEDLKAMTYLECCIKEVLRLFPSVPIFARRIDESFEISEHFTIPRGSEVLICPYIVHRDPKHWPDPECFDPDRFLPRNSHGRHPFAYLPFSAGARNCIGQRFAMIEEKVILSWILRFFRVTSLPRRDQVMPKAEMILRPSETVLMKFERRQPLSI